MQDMLTNLSTYGYILLFFYTLGGGFLALIAAGVLSFLGEMNIIVTIAIATLSNTLGDTLLFYLGRYNKPALMPYIKNHKRKLAYSQILMKKHGDKMIFIQKYIYGVKTLVPIALGFSKYPFFKFNILNFIASFIWAFIIGTASFLAGNFAVKFWDKFGDNGWVMPIFMLILLGLIWLFLEKQTKKRI
ncbi:DedA family protein [Campylobacter gastrosuis]|uniref:DedA family protein n=1 Tax=Campylobacter gastrosuis TaxID=2974576 RepID=A0ABT7HTM2_9BACT|nr:DedA family protein [Campylobacter gastrosuis]MDL0089719.1 DedA family protein [Campylobacter gastrosuis]